MYGNTKSQIRIEFEYEFKDSYNQIVEDAKQIGDSRYLEESLENEDKIGLYSFKPWWAGIE